MWGTRRVDRESVPLPCWTGLFAGILHGAYELSCNPFENQIVVESRIEANEIATALRACEPFGRTGLDQECPRLELYGLSFDLDDQAVTARNCSRDVSPGDQVLSIRNTV
jgi:hypothetical protein